MDHLFIDCLSSVIFPFFFFFFLLIILGYGFFSGRWDRFSGVLTMSCQEDIISTWLITVGAALGLLDEGRVSGFPITEFLPTPHLFPGWVWAASGWAIHTFLVPCAPPVFLFFFVFCFFFFPHSPGVKNLNLSCSLSTFYLVNGLFRHTTYLYVHCKMLTPK